MALQTKYLQVSTKGFCDVIDITDKVEAALSSVSEMTEGSVTIFVPGSTAGLTTIEYETGCVEDLKSTFERLAPQGATMPTMHGGGTAMDFLTFGPPC